MVKFGVRVQTWNSLPMPNFVQKKSLKSIGPLASDLKQEFHIFTILVDVSKGTMVKFGVRVWTWVSLPHA